MSIVASILLNAPPPVFKGKVIPHILMEDNRRRVPRQNEYLSRITAPPRYKEAIKKLGGKATAREIADVIGVGRPAANRYILSKKNKFFRAVGEVQKGKRGGRPPQLWQWIGD